MSEARGGALAVLMALSPGEVPSAEEAMVTEAQAATGTRTMAMRSSKKLGNPDSLNLTTLPILLGAADGIEEQSPGRWSCTTQLDEW
mmetsp:Transcript_36361/g.66609  ORF Transcript_36361/g.66609 Transcript_36361/m.66609 type:complete len:87 (+) Transcript_36361:297-557(+)